jgi:MoaA/NifB/PqqE/SkfB family radical SAM enzyme
MSACQAFGDFTRELAGRHGAFPAAASFELTARCNLACRYCYLRPYRDEPELATDEILRILDALAGAGCLSLLLTGGEPLLREDFPEIWRAAKRRGFLLSLYTNATRVTDETLALLREWPPLLVEATLYGWSAETYASFCGDGAAWEDACRGVERLAALGRPLHLKAPVLRANRREIPALRAWADDLGLPLYVDTEVFPRLDGDPAPLAEALPPDEALAALRETPLAREAWAREFGRPRPPARIDRLLVCNGGEHAVHIGPYGDLAVCMLLREPSWSLRRGTLAAGWDFLHNEVRARAAPPERPCAACPDLGWCLPCAGKNRLATGEAARPAPFVCERAAALRRLLAAEEEEEGVDVSRAHAG